MPVHDHGTPLDIDRLHNRPRKKRYQPFVASLDHHYVIGTGLQHSDDLAEMDTIRGGNPQPDEIRPVELAIVRIRESRTLHRDLASPVATRHIAVVAAMEPRNHLASMHLPFGNANRGPAPVQANLPWCVPKNILRRLRARTNPNPAPSAIRPGDATEHDTAVRPCRHPSPPSQGAAGGVASRAATASEAASPPHRSHERRRTSNARRARNRSGSALRSRSQSG